MHTHLSRSLLLALAAAAGAGALGAQSLAERVLDVKASYQVDAWPLGQVRDGLPLDALALAGFRAGPVSSQGALVGRDFSSADGPLEAAPLFHLEFQVFDSSEAARELLVLWLAGLSSPSRAPLDSSFGVELGEAGYVGPSGAGQKAFSWVAFVRGNVAVRLLNVDPRTAPELALPAIAARIDAAIAARTPLAAAVAVPKPEIATLKAATSSAVAGERVKLDVSALDPSGGTAHLAWTVAGTGQGYVEERADGWYLFTTGPGELTVTLGVVSSTGTYAERSLALDVADD
jgi:hypothetical protein